MMSKKAAEAIYVVKFACEGGGQIEPETIYVHFRHPIAKRIHDELQHLRMPHIQCVAGPGIVHVKARIVVHQPVISRVIDTPHAEHGA